MLLPCQSATDYHRSLFSSRTYLFLLNPICESDKKTSNECKSSLFVLKDIKFTESYFFIQPQDRTSSRWLSLLVTYAIHILKYIVYVHALLMQKMPIQFLYLDRDTTEWIINKARRSNVQIIHKPCSNFHLKTCTDVSTLCFGSPHAWGNNHLLQTAERQAWGLGCSLRQSTTLPPGLLCPCPGSYSCFGKGSLACSALLAEGFSSFACSLVASLSDHGCSCFHPVQMLPPLPSVPCQSPDTPKDLPDPCTKCVTLASKHLHSKAPEPTLRLVQTCEELSWQRKLAKLAKKTFGDACHYPSLAEKIKDY